MKRHQIGAETEFSPSATERSALPATVESEAERVEIDDRCTLYHGDCLEVMRALQADSVGTIVTSPPYNMRCSRNQGGNAGSTRRTWNASVLINEGYDGDNDKRTEPEYIAWQRKCLAEMMRLLAPHGAIFYVMKWRVRGGLLKDCRDIVEGFPVRQILIWDRGGDPNVSPRFFMPNYEVIYLITKPAFRLRSGTNGVGSVWRIPPARDNPHPAPFPFALAQRCIASMPDGPVLDPFCGSGTTAVAARVAGQPFVGIDQSRKYIDMTVDRIKRQTGDGPLFEAAAAE